MPPRRRAVKGGAKMPPSRAVALYNERQLLLQRVKNERFSFSLRKINSYGLGLCALVGA